MGRMLRKTRRAYVAAALFAAALLAAGGLYIHSQEDAAPGHGVTITETVRI